MEPLENAEQLFGISHVKTCAIIFDVVTVFSLSALRATNFDPPVLLGSRKLDGIGQEVSPDLAGSWLDRRAPAARAGASIRFCVPAWSAAVPQKPSLPV